MSHVFSSSYPRSATSFVGVKVIITWLKLYRESRFWRKEAADPVPPEPCSSSEGFNRWANLTGLMWAKDLCGRTLLYCHRQSPTSNLASVKSTVARGPSTQADRDRGHEREESLRYGNGNSGCCGGREVRGKVVA